MHSTADRVSTRFPRVRSLGVKFRGAAGLALFGRRGRSVAEDRAQAEAEKEAAGCGSKRKPVLERDEELAAFVARMESLRPLYGEEDVSDGYNSQDDDPDTTFDDVMAQLERQIQANNARWPFLIGRGLIKSHEDTDGAPLV